MERAEPADRNYALAGYDRPQIFQMAFVYELPYKTTSPAGASAMQAVFGDWQVNGIYSAYSGTPFTITASGADLNMPGNPQTANLNGELQRASATRQAGFYFDPIAFSQPTGVAFGNTGRNQFRGPGYWNVDFSLFRAFPIGRPASGSSSGRRSSTCSNHPKWGNPDTRLHQLQLRAQTFRRSGNGSAGRGHGRTADSPRRPVPVLVGLQAPGSRLRRPGRPRRRGLRSSPAFSLYGRRLSQSSVVPHFESEGVQLYSEA